MCLCVCVPQEIVQQLIDNSSTFRDKTGYAQEKYIKKKKKKWVISNYTNSNCYRLEIMQSAVISVISYSRLGFFQVRKYCDDSKTVLSHPGYDVPRPGAGEGLVSQHVDQHNVWKWPFNEQEDVELRCVCFRVTQPPAVWLTRPDVDSRKHPRWQQGFGVWDLCRPRAGLCHGKNGR